MCRAFFDRLGQYCACGTCACVLYKSLLSKERTCSCWGKLQLLFDNDRASCTDFLFVFPCVYGADAEHGNACDVAEDWTSLNLAKLSVCDVLQHLGGCIIVPNQHAEATAVPASASPVLLWCCHWDACESFAGPLGCNGSCPVCVCVCRPFFWVCWWCWQRICLVPRALLASPARQRGWACTVGLFFFSMARLADLSCTGPIVGRVCLRSNLVPHTNSITVSKHWLHPVHGCDAAHQQHHNICCFAAFSQHCSPAFGFRTFSQEVAGAVFVLICRLLRCSRCSVHPPQF